MVTITSPEASDDDKQLVIITAGTHGPEEAGRLVAMALMEWLASGEPLVTLRNQIFVIFPCVNPDGSVRNTGPNGEGVDIYRSYGTHGEPISHEGRLVYDGIRGLNPAVVVDCHGLAGGAMNEEFYVHPAFRNSPANFLGAMMSRVCQLAWPASATASATPTRRRRTTILRR